MTSSSSAALHIVGVLLFVANMGAPAWVAWSIPVLPGCQAYSGTFGTVYSGCGPLLDGYEAHGQPDIDTQIWQAGTALALIFGLFGVAIKIAACGAPNIRERVQTGICLQVVAIGGAIASIVQVARIVNDTGDLDDYGFTLNLYACFYLQIIATLLVGVSVVLDALALGKPNTEKAYTDVCDYNRQMREAQKLPRYFVNPAQAGPNNV
jgi:hypothetical protein